MKKLKKSILVCISVFIFIVLIIWWLLCPKATTYKGNDVDEYLEYDWHVYDGGTPSEDINGFFPEKLNESLQIINYYYRAEFPSGWVATFWELVLHVKYEDDDFIQEIHRLEDYVVKDNELLEQRGMKKEISLEIINSELFCYETIIHKYYVSNEIFGTFCEYTYALLNRMNSEIIYVYLRSPIGNKHNPYIDKNFLPLNYFKNEKKRTADCFNFTNYHYIPSE